jgi:hypothetical protein
VIKKAHVFERFDRLVEIGSGKTRKSGLSHGHAIILRDFSSSCSRSIERLHPRLHELRLGKIAAREKVVLALDEKAHSLTKKRVKQNFFSFFSSPRRMRRNY